MENSLIDLGVCFLAADFAVDFKGSQRCIILINKEAVVPECDSD